MNPKINHNTTTHRITSIITTETNQLTQIFNPSKKPMDFTPSKTLEINFSLFTNGNGLLKSYTTQPKISLPKIVPS